MIQGEPLEETARHGAQDDKTVGCGPVMVVPTAESAPEPAESAPVPSVEDFLARTMEEPLAQDMSDDDSLDADVKDLVDALDSAERAHDDAWVEEAQKDESDAETAEDSESAVIALPASPVTVEKSDVSVPETDVAEEASEEVSEPEASREEAAASDDRAPEAASPDLLGLQAIGVLNEKISSSEERYDGALSKIGHALGVIAERIDGLETRMTSQTIANVATVAAPSKIEVAEPPQADDGSVAPYIAQAERELAARKESGPMDIFDRIAQAAETEFDGQAATGGTRVIDNASAGRRVGTKRWQPSKTVKRRMEQLEQAKAGGTATGEAALDLGGNGPRSLRADVEEITGATAKPVKPGMAAKASAVPEEFEDEDDDAGLSVVPGARGRRRNRARKSRLDEDFENIFTENETPSIQNLRRKMRDRPADEELAEDAAKGGMLGGILGKKAAKKAAAPVVAPIEEDEEDLMAAFDAPELREDKPVRKKMKASAVEADEETLEDESGKGIRFAGGPLLYVLIAGLAAAGFFAYQQFLA